MCACMTDESRTISQVHAFERALRPLFLLSVVLVYTYLGAYIFHLVEEPTELAQRRTSDKLLHEARRNTSGQIRTLYNDLQSTDRLYELDTLLQNLQTTVDQIYSEHGRHVANSSQWDLWGAATYSISLYTTLGYGKLEASTGRGRVWTIIYALIGIPLLVFVIYDLGRGLASIWIGSYMRCGNRRHNKRGSYHLGVQTSLLHMPVLPMVMALFVWVFLAALIIMCTEGTMSYAHALYLMVESQATIGLHNLLPDDRRFMVLLVALVFVGLVLMSAVVQLVAAKMHAVHAAILEGVHSQYRAVQVEGAEFGIDMAVDEAGASCAIRRLLHQLPAGSRIYYALMSNDRKAALSSHWIKLAKCQATGTQTDEYLSRSYALQMTAFKEEDQRSHDDVNSLVGMCDWTI